MGDLISRSAVIEAINKVVEEYEGKELIPSIFSANAVILNQPTAYDVDRVVEQLIELHREGYCPDEDGDACILNKACGECYEDRLIEIVKAGGKSEN